MGKPLECETRSFSMKMEKCQDCDGVLIHDYYTKEEQKEKTMNLGEAQRNSFCPTCRILYINGKS